MPSPGTILAGLTSLSNAYQPIAIGFHVFLAIIVVFLAAGAPLSKRLVGTMLCAPLVSVSVLAWVSSNPFNGALFAVLAALLLVFSIRLPVTRVRIASAPVAIVGFVLFAFGWVYPHFLETSSFLPYLYAAPVGIVPCPTLSTVIGLALVVDSFQARGWGLVAAIAGLLYGLFGAFRLGVALDWALVAGAAALAVYAVTLKGQPAQKPVRA